MFVKLLQIRRPTPSLICVEIAETHLRGMSAILTSPRLPSALPRFSSAPHSSCLHNNAFLGTSPYCGSGDLVDCGAEWSSWRKLQQPPDSPEAHRERNVWQLMALERFLRPVLYSMESAYDCPDASIWLLVSSTKRASGHPSAVSVQKGWLPCSRLHRPNRGMHMA